MVAKPLSPTPFGERGTATLREATRSVVAGRGLDGVMRRALVLAAIAPVAVVSLAAGFGEAEFLVAMALAVAVAAGVARLVSAWAIADLRAVVAASQAIAATGQAQQLPQPAFAEARDLASAMNGIVARFGEANRRLRRQALHDSLTGLPNRELFMSRLTRALADRRPDAGPLAVMFLDVDDFKTLNDTMGHGAGDAFLMAFSQRVRSAARGPHTVARLGGDEFAVIIEAGAAEVEARLVADRIHDALRRPFSVSEKQVTVTTSVGIAVTSRREVAATELLRIADIGLYRAKDRGKNRYVLLHADDGRPARRIVG